MRPTLRTLRALACLLLAGALAALSAAGCGGGKPATGTQGVNIEPAEKRQSMEDAMKKYSESLKAKGQGHAAKH